MIKHILGFFSILLSSTLIAQITIDQGDIGQAGDSITVAYETLTGSTPVGAASSTSQIWNFTFSVDDINTLKFEFLSNTSSGSYFSNSNLAIERQADTLFFGSSTSAFTLDGVTGDGFGLGASVRADFNPDATVLTFPSTYGTSFVDTAVFDTIVSCAAFGQGSLCDSARLRRQLISTSVFDAYGELHTSGGSYDNTIRQYLREDNQDRVWVKLPFIGWQTTPFYSADSTEYNYLWYAEDEKWPVLSAVADGLEGDIISVEFQVDNLLGYVAGVNDPACFSDCNGSATIQGIGAEPPYSYVWPASAASQTTATANNLCAGVYTVTISDMNSDTYELEVTVTEPSELLVNGSVQGVSMGGDGAIDITASGGSGTGTYTYSWTGPDGFTATSSDISGLEEGDYEVVVTDANGCETTMTFMVSLTSIGSVEEAGFKMYPNPANDNLRITANENIHVIRISDLLGNMVSSQRANAATVDLTLGDLSSGIYMVEVQTGKGTYLRKLTVRH